MARTDGVDKIVNAVGGKTMGHFITAIGSGGELGVMGLFTENEVPVTITVLMGNEVSIRGTSVGGAKAFHDLVAEIDDKGSTPTSSRCSPFDDADEAYRTQARGAFGKIVISGTA